MANMTDVVKAVANETPEVKNALLNAGVRLESASLSEIAPPIITDPLTLNAFLGTLYNKFIFSEVINGRFYNPLEPLKKGRLAPFGDTVERMIFNPAKAISYFDTDDNILTTVKPDVKVEYIKITRQDKYPISLPRPLVEQAFSSEGTFGEFMTGAMNTLYNGDAIDEFLLMKKIASDMFNAHYLLYEEMGDTSTDITKQIINTVKEFKFPSTDNNVYSHKYPDDKLVTWCDPSDVVIVATADTMTDIKVDTLANAFNLSEIELGSNIIEVDKFDVDGLKILVCDRAYFQVRDSLTELAQFFRADDLSTKSYYHHWQTMTCSLFANCKAFVSKGTTPTPPNTEGGN